MFNSAKKVVVVGAGKHAWLIAEKIAEQSDLKLLGFIDKSAAELPDSIRKQGAMMLGDDRYLDQAPGNFYVHIGLGAGLLQVRRRIINQINQRKHQVVSVVHRTAYIAPSANVGRGVTALVHTIIHTNATVGDFTCVNTGAIIEHDCQIGSNVFVQPGSVLAGSVTVGDDTIIGMGVCVREGIRIGSNCLIGAGAVVVKDIPDNSVVYGVPAQVIKQNN